MDTIWHLSNLYHPLPMESIILLGKHNSKPENDYRSRAGGKSLMTMQVQERYFTEHRFSAIN
jgi:hypothetical protein